MVVGLGQGADLHMAQLMRLQIGFTFLVLDHLGNPGQSPDGHKMDVYVCVLQSFCVTQSEPQGCEKQVFDKSDIPSIADSITASKH